MCLSEIKKKYIFSPPLSPSVRYVLCRFIWMACRGSSERWHVPRRHSRFLLFWWPVIGSSRKPGGYWIPLVLNWCYCWFDNERFRSPLKFGSWKPIQFPHCQLRLFFLGFRVFFESKPSVNVDAKTFCYFSLRVFHCPFIVTDGQTVLSDNSRLRVLSALTRVLSDLPATALIHSSAMYCYTSAASESEELRPQMPRYDVVRGAAYKKIGPTTLASRRNRSQVVISSCCLRARSGRTRCCDALSVPNLPLPVCLSTSVRPFAFLYPDLGGSPSRAYVHFPTLARIL